MKRTELSSSDKIFIEEHYDKLSPKDIAAKLNKTELTVSKYLTNIMKVEPFEEREFEGSVLRTKPEWEHLKQEFTPEELRLFEHTYTKMISQFNDDVLATEEKQIFQAIELEIFMHRNKKAQKRAAEEINRIQLEITEEQECDEDDWDRDRIDKLRHDLAGYLAAQGATYKQYTEYSDKHDKLLRGIKGTRDQRVKQDIDKNLNILEKLKYLADEENRRREKIEAELFKEAIKKQEEKYSNIHTYADNSIDLPILTKENYQKIQKEDDNG